MKSPLANRDSKQDRLSIMNLAQASIAQPKTVAATTDDRGEYRIAEASPGKHLLAVEYSDEQIRRNGRSGPRLTWPASGGFVIYPDATDASLKKLRVVS